MAEKYCVGEKLRDMDGYKWLIITEFTAMDGLIYRAINLGASWLSEAKGRTADELVRELEAIEEIEIVEASI